MTIRRLFPFLLISGLVMAAVAHSPDPDVWWHLRTGEHILRDGLPSHDVFSYTARDHAWVTHEWLTQVFMWLVYSAGGFPALNVAFAAVFTAAFFLVYLRCDGRPYLAAPLVAFAALTASIVRGPRPQIFNLLFFAAFIFIVEAYKDGAAGSRPRPGRAAGGRPAPHRVLLALPVLSAIWANFHSGYLLGVALLATYTVGEAAQLLVSERDERGLGWDGVRRLALTGAACFAAALLNPSGYKLWTYPLETLGSSVQQAWIQEWRSPNFHHLPMWFFAAMLALGVASWAFSRRRPAWTDLLLFLGTAGAGLVSARHIPIFAVASVPIISRNLLRSLEGTRLHAELGGRAAEDPPEPGRVAVYWGVAAVVAGLAVVSTTVGIRDYAAGVAKSYPQAAVDFLEREGLASRRVYNTYHWGGYLIWRGIPVFVDGRPDVYGDEFVRAYGKTYYLGPDWREPLDRYAVDYVLIGKSSALSTLLAASREWREVYRDELAVVYVREGRGTGG
jgi:hypothetical protein